MAKSKSSTKSPGKSKADFYWSVKRLIFSVIVLVLCLASIIGGLVIGLINSEADKDVALKALNVMAVNNSKAVTANGNAIGMLPETGSAVYDCSFPRWSWPGVKTASFGTCTVDAATGIGTVTYGTEKYGVYDCVSYGANVYVCANGSYPLK